MANIVQGALDARQAGFSEQQGITEQLTRRRAGQQMARGNLPGASAELYGAGMIGDGLQLENAGIARERQAAQDEVQAEDRDIAAQKRSVEFLTQAARVLKQIPEAERQGAYAGQIAPALKTMGMDDALIEQAGQSLDDRSLDTFIGEAENQMKMFSTASGIVGVTPQGKASLVYEDPLAQEYKRAQIGATEARAGASNASAAASRARAAGRGGSGGGRGGAPAAASPARVSSQAEYARLPSGSVFVAPDGSVRRKP